MRASLFAGVFWAGVMTAVSAASAQGLIEESVTPPSVEGEASEDDAPGQRLEPPTPASEAPLFLVLVGFDDAEERALLRRRLAAELGVPVVSTEESGQLPPGRRVVVTRGTDARELAVSYVDGSGHTTTRVVDDPSTVEDRGRLVVFLAGSFVKSAAREPAPSVEPSPLPEPSAEPAQEAPPEPEAPRPLHPAHFSLFHPLASNVNEPNVETYFSLAVLYGRVGYLKGLGFGGFQLATEGFEGVQLSFLGNVSHGAASGVQGALGFNSARELEGLQLASVNHVSDDVAGAQVGFINVAGKVSGVQLGVINIADDVEGVPLGLVSVTKSGGVHPLVWYSNNSYVNAGIQFATKYTYTFVHASFATEDYKTGPGFGFGGIIPTFVPQLFVDVDLGQTVLFDDRGDFNDIRYLTRVRGSLRFQFLKHLGVFVGGGVVGKIEKDWKNLREYPAVSALPYVYETLGEFFAGVRL